MSKAVLVTGATGNLGSEVCKILNEASYKVYGTSLPDSNESSAHAEILEADLTNPSDASTLIQQIKAKEQALHGVVCLAGGFGMGNISNTEPEAFEKFFKLNFITATNTIHAAWDWMKENGKGNIVLVGAKPALEGGSFDVLPYAISKGAVIQLSAALNEKSKDTGIVSSVIVPSIIDTPPNRETMADADFSDWVTPNEIANQIAHLLAEKSKSLRQTVLKVYGNS